MNLFSLKNRKNNVGRDTGATDYFMEESADAVKLHLGCGNNLLPGWINIDLTGPPPVVQWDLTMPLPLPAESVDYIFNEHFIEHITRSQAKALLDECSRLLKADGVLRISTPNLSKLIEEYLHGRTSEWRDVGWVPASPCQMLNEGMRLWGHQFVYDRAEFEQLLRESGFAEVRSVPWRKSENLFLCNLECRPYHEEIILEASKNLRAAPPQLLNRGI